MEKMSNIQSIMKIVICVPNPSEQRARLHTSISPTDRFPVERGFLEEELQTVFNNFTTKPSVISSQNLQKHQQIKNQRTKTGNNPKTSSRNRNSLLTFLIRRENVSGENKNGTLFPTLRHFFPIYRHLFSDF